jgi:hypothetical protein
MEGGSVREGEVEVGTREHQRDSRNFRKLGGDGVDVDGIDGSSGDWRSGSLSVVTSNESYGSGGSGECGLF